MLRKLFYDFTYRFQRPPWDTGITPPEVVALIEHDHLRGRALDLGCGTGTNSIYLARHGLQVVGVDFVSQAIATAREKAERAGVNVEFKTGDVTRLDALGVHGPFDLVLDIGCFHSLSPASRERYAAQVAQLTCSGGIYMLYAFSPRPADQKPHLIPARNVGVSEEEVRSLFSPHYTAMRIERGSERGERASAWYWWKRNPAY